MTLKIEPLPAAPGFPVERRVRALDPERAAFERWLMDVHMLDGTWNEKRNCYDEFPCHLAFQAWMAARPRRHEVGRLVNLAAKCLHPDMMRGLWRLEEESGRTLGRRALSAALADADENLRLLAIELRRVSDAL